MQSNISPTTTLIRENGLIKKEVLELISQLMVTRNKLREEGRFDKADIIREELDNLGVEVSDSKDNTTIRFKTLVPISIIDWESLVKHSIGRDYIVIHNCEYIATKIVKEIKE